MKDNYAQYLKTFESLFKGVAGEKLSLEERVNRKQKLNRVRNRLMNKHSRMILNQYISQKRFKNKFDTEKTEDGGIGADLEGFFQSQINQRLDQHSKIMDTQM